MINYIFRPLEELNKQSDMGGTKNREPVSFCWLLSNLIVQKLSVCNNKWESQNKREKRRKKLKQNMSQRGVTWLRLRSIISSSERSPAVGKNVSETRHNSPIWYDRKRLLISVTARWKFYSGLSRTDIVTRRLHTHTHTHTNFFFLFPAMQNAIPAIIQ